MKSIFIFLLLCTITTASFAQELTPGSVVPKAVFYKLDGMPYSTDLLSKEKKSLIMFFDATCDHCQRVATVLSKRSAELSGINVYLVSVDQPQSINYFTNKFAKPLIGLKNVTVLQDKDMVFIPLFKPKQYPTLYLYGKDKRLVYTSSNEKDVPKFFPLLK
ncbi:MAG: redoxin domain-containing protein [Pedobacter sp.]|nr:MAG: redoxin domain-containing protein [Pedobacter sp.]